MYLLFKESPVYESVQKNGLKKFWVIRIITDVHGKFYTQTESWQELKDGGNSQSLVSEPFEVTPKNIGKANETTTQQQALLEYESIIKTQRDKKQYLLPGESRDNLLPLPMLAQPYDKHKKKIQFPCIAQIKYDGHRMLFRDGKGWTRGGQYHLPEVIQHLTFDTKGHTFDGELVLPGTELLQKTASAVKKYQKGVSDQLFYVIYDVIDVSEPYLARLSFLKNFFATESLPKNVVLAPSHVMSSENDVQEFFKETCNQGYEGIILRNLAGKYLIKDRSYDLQKYKPFFEEEYKIIGVVPMGGGNAAQLGKFVLETETGHVFESVYQADFEERAQLLKDGYEKYKGKYAQCRYPYKSATGIPQHARVVDIRETKNLGF